MRNDTYASILGAVGSVLDLAEARSFAVREGEHGLTLDLIDGRGERHTVDLSLADVAALTSWAQRSEATRDYTAERRDEGTLRTFLERRTLVGAH
ncbi:MAG TPA: hypothetical protein VF812_11355 [Ktedonobacterales bacterium]